MQAPTAPKKRFWDPLQWKDSPLFGSMQKVFGFFRSPTAVGSWPFRHESHVSPEECPFFLQAGPPKTCCDVPFAKLVPFANPKKGCQLQKNDTAQKIPPVCVLSCAQLTFETRDFLRASIRVAPRMMSSMSCADRSQFWASGNHVHLDCGACPIFDQDFSSVLQLLGPAWYV